MQQFRFISTLLFSLSLFGLACDPSVEQSTADGGQKTDGPSENTDGVGADFYEPGEHAVEVVSIAKGEGESPRNIRVMVPEDGGAHPVIFFFPGFLCVASWYDSITTHLASYGFIVATIQTVERGLGFPVNRPKIPEETLRAIDAVQWLKDNLDSRIEATPDLSSTGYAGHSRGAKIAWNIVRTRPDLLVGAIAGIDPVDGTGVPAGSDIQVIKEPLTYDMPSLVFGTGLGPVVKSMMACAPKNDGHLHFWENVPSPAYHVVAVEFGHMEMLDDGVSCGATCSSCASSQNGNRETLRRQIGGSLALFFNSALRGETTCAHLLTEPELAPALITTDSK